MQDQDFFKSIMITILYSNNIAALSIKETSDDNIIENYYSQFNGEMDEINREGSFGF